MFIFSTYLIVFLLKFRLGELVGRYVENLSKSTGRYVENTNTKCRFFPFSSKINKYYFIILTIILLFQLLFYYFPEEAHFRLQNSSNLRAKVPIIEILEEYFWKNAFGSYTFWEELGEIILEKNSYLFTSVSILSGFGSICVDLFSVSYYADVLYVFHGSNMTWQMFP